MQRLHAPFGTWKYLTGSHDDIEQLLVKHFLVAMGKKDGTTGDIAHLQAAGAEPFEIARFLAVECWREPRGRLRLDRRGSASRDVADEQFVRDRFLQQPICVPQMAPKQIVELEIVGRRMIVAVPPEPVAALGDEHFFPRFGDRGGVGRRRLVQGLPRVCELTPAALIVGMADPDVEVGVDPRSGEDARQFGRRRRRFRAGFAHRHSPQLGVSGEPAVYGPEERATAPLEVFPRVLTVEDDRDERLSFSAASPIPFPSAVQLAGSQALPPAPCASRGGGRVLSLKPPRTCARRGSGI